MGQLDSTELYSPPTSRSSQNVGGVGTVRSSCSIASAGAREVAIPTFFAGAPATITCGSVG
jgi:hypothetical protein